MHKFSHLFMSPFILLVIGFLVAMAPQEVRVRPDASEPGELRPGEFRGVTPDVFCARYAGQFDVVESYPEAVSNR